MCRVVNFERTAVYQIDSYFTQLTKQKLLKLTDYVNFPVGICLDAESHLTIVEHKQVSLYEILHSLDGAARPEVLTPLVKRAILINLARLMNTLHSLLQPIYHGHLSSHNVFVQIPDWTD